MKENQDVDYVRGDAMDIAYTITLDESRTLDDTELWSFSVRKYVDGTKGSGVIAGSAGLVIQRTKTGGAITVSGQVVTVGLVAADFAEVTKTQDINYACELAMVKDTLPETQARGNFKLRVDIDV